jgi:hypothetical protein
VFLPHSSKGCSDNLKKSEMNVDDFMKRAAKVLGFEDNETALKILLDPTKSSEPRAEPCVLFKPPQR